jgi:hypothetical protein
MSTDLIQVRFEAIPSCGWPVTGLLGPWDCGHVDRGQARDTLLIFNS